MKQLPISREMPQMVVGGKRHQKALEGKYQKILNKKDPFDQLILELGRTGVLDVSIVGIKDEYSTPLAEEYSQKSIRHKGKHTS
jgi:hypothetical protein